MCLQCAAYHASPFALPLSVLSLLISCLWPPPVHAENLSVGLVVAYSSHIFRSPRILDGGETAMTRLCRNLLNNGGETAMLARQKSPLILRRNLHEDDDDGSPSNSWQRQDCDGKTAHYTATSSMTVARLQYWRISNHLQFGGVTSWQWRWRRVGNLLEFLTVVTLQCQRISSLTTTACNVLANSLIQRCLWVGSWVVACWLALLLGRVPKFGSGTKLFEKVFSQEFRKLKLYFKKFQVFDFFKIHRSRRNWGFVPAGKCTTILLPPN